MHVDGAGVEWFRRARLPSEPSDRIRCFHSSDLSTIPITGKLIYTGRESSAIIAISRQDPNEGNC